MEINLIKQDSSRVPRAFVSNWFKELILVLKKEKTTKNRKKLSLKEVSLVFVEKKVIKSLNLKYRNVNKPTDVLSFSGDDFFMFGELVFCPDVIIAKARSLNLSYRLYLCFLMTHGTLHLLGYEHEESQKKEREMFAFQDKIFKKVAAKLAPEAKNDFHISLAH